MIAVCPLFTPPEPDKLSFALGFAWGLYVALISTMVLARVCGVVG